eukprot:6106024-Amphidinium_carterae.1
MQAWMLVIQAGGSRAPGKGVEAFAGVDAFALGGTLASGEAVCGVFAAFAGAAAGLVSARGFLGAAIVGPLAELEGPSRWAPEGPLLLDASCESCGHACACAPASEAAWPTVGSCPCVRTQGLAVPWAWPGQAPLPHCWSSSRIHQWWSPALAQLLDEPLHGHTGAVGSKQLVRAAPCPARRLGALPLAGHWEPPLEAEAAWEGSAALLCEADVSPQQVAG